jgi:hypothetical protein
MDANCLSGIGETPYDTSMSRVKVMRLNNVVIHRTMWLTSTQPTHSLNPATGGRGSVDPSSAVAGETSMQLPGRMYRAPWKGFLFGKAWNSAALGLLLLGILSMMPLMVQADGVGISAAFTTVPGNDGNIQTGGFRAAVNQYVYAYVGVGEKLRFDVRKLSVADPTNPPTAVSDLPIWVYSPNGLVFSTTIDGLAAIGTSVNNGTTPNATYTATATTAGIWTIRMWPPADGTIYWGYDIDVLSSANAVKTGRVYTELVAMAGNDAIATPGGVTFNLHHINNYGYEYLSKFSNYMGIDSYIVTDRYGVTEASDCISAYRSADSGDPTVRVAPVACGGRFKQFFTAIDQTIPVSAPRFDVTTNTPAVTEWLNPSLVNPTITGLSFNKTLGNPAAGSFTFTVGNYAGNATLQIDANNDGDYIDAVDRSIPISTVEGANSQQFNGLNGQGGVIGCGQVVGARVQIDKPGEIHFTMGDVEGLGGLQITRTNGPAAGNSTIYWDDTSLTTAGRTSVTSPLNGTSGVNSTSVATGVHGWTYSGNAWGNVRYIDNWAYTSQSATAVTSLTTVCDYGDAPASYSTTAAGGGPSHAQLGLVYIGNLVDAESNGTANAGANSDDTNGIDDEDGITNFPPILVECTNTYSITVPITNTTGTGAVLGGWVDFNRNGIFDGGEFSFIGVPNGATTATLTWNNIQNLGITAGQSYIRLRISTQPFSQPGGTLPDGEVEDYPVTILQGLVASVTSTSATSCSVPDGTITLTASGGTSTYQYSEDGGVTWTNFTSPTILTGKARNGYIIIIRDAGATSCITKKEVLINAPDCCDYNQLEPITFGAYNPGAGFTVKYLLTTTSGLILAISDTPVFPAQTVGSYLIRTLVYNTASPAPTGVTVGTNVSGIAGCCFQLGVPTPVSICECPTLALVDTNPYQICAGTPLAQLQATTSAASPSQVEFILFTTQQTSASAVYAAPPVSGTVLGAGNIVNSVATLSNVSFPTTPGTYYVYARILPAPADSSCRPFLEIPVVVTACCTLTATASSNSPICAADEIQLRAFTEGGTGNFTYSWTGPNGFNSTEQNPTVLNVTLAAAGSYTLVVTDTMVPGCSSSSTIGVTILPAPSLTVTSSSGTTICSGQSTSLTVGGSNGSSVTWKNNFGQTGTGTQIPVQYSNVGTEPLIITYVISASNASGCTDSDTVQVIINPVPTLLVVPTDGSVKCENENVTLHALASAGTATIDWTRTPNTPNPPPASGNGVGLVDIDQHLPEGSYTYQFTATLNGCTSQPVSRQITVQQ